MKKKADPLLYQDAVPARVCYFAPFHRARIAAAHARTEFRRSQQNRYDRYKQTYLTLDNSWDRAASVTVPIN